MTVGALKYREILVVSNHVHAASIVVCMIKAGHKVTLLSSLGNDIQLAVTQHLEEVNTFEKLKLNSTFSIVEELNHSQDFGLAIIYTEEDLSVKKALVDRVQKFDSRLKILVNAASVALKEIQENCLQPQHVGIANWSFPMHNTYFLELVANNTTDQSWLSVVEDHAKNHWGKDPYLINDEYGIRSQMLTAMLREACYLVQNGYASVEDIDRACRNDPGYYLPFSGNFRYMDLMGTFAYGMVMKDLNPELAIDTSLPKFLADKLEMNETTGEATMLYSLTPTERLEEEAKFRKFSYEIKSIIEKYPAL